MTLKQLEAFYWAANCASFVQAAERVHLSVSSLSKRISELELDLGKPLFNRDGHKAILTDAGQLLLPRAKALLAQAEEARSAVIKDVSLRGVCRFGVGEISALTWLPKVIRVARERYPELKLEPSVDAGSSLGSLEQKVFEGVLDFAVIAGRPTRSAILSEHIGEAHFKWVASRSLTGKAVTVTAEMLADIPVISSPPGTGSTRVLNDWLDATNMTIGQRLSCNSWAGVAGLLAEGLGIGILPASWAIPMTRSGDLRLLKIEHPMQPLRYAFHWRKDDHRPLIGSMLQAVKDCIDFEEPVRWLRQLAVPLSETARPRSS
ncbi:LysR family transcriptional regulator [Variovorax rhizosphaerae]|uniref:LysR family transcriptional regulator n=1 Tax=Variovorax rhizosphaerae TaxID=1836200 RepID=A0ABU8WR03_9BURK